jgi:hypothetical protein
MWNLRYVNQFLPDSAFIVTSINSEAVPEAFKVCFGPLGRQMNLAITPSAIVNQPIFLAGKEFYVLSPRRRDERHEKDG